MKIVNKFINNIKWLLVANFYIALSKFIILILLAHITTATEVGIYSLGLAVTAPITLLFNMKMKSVIVTANELNIDVYSKIRKMANLFAIVLIIIITLIFYQTYFVAFLLIGIIKILDLNSEFYQSLHNRNKNFHLTSILIISKTTIITLVFTITLFLTESLELSLFVYIVFQLLHLIIEKHYFDRYKELENQEKIISYRVLLTFLIPLGLSQMLYSFGASIPKYFLEYFGTIEQVGIFSALLYFVTIVNLFMNSILQSLLPYIRELYYKNKASFHKYIYAILPIFALGTGVMLVFPVMFFGEKLLNIIYGTEYGSYYEILYLLIIVIIFSIVSWTFDAALLVSRKTKLQPLLTFINILVVLGVGLIISSYNFVLGASLLLILYHMINSLSKIFYYQCSK